MDKVDTSTASGELTVCSDFVGSSLQTLVNSERQPTLWTPKGGK